MSEAPKFYRVWASDNTVDDPPKECPLVHDDGLDFFERRLRDFRELQRRGW